MSKVHFMDNIWFSPPSSVTKISSALKCLAPLKNALTFFEQGLRAIFGETYPDPVRVLSVGAIIEDLIDSTKGEVDAFQNSVEFCGGT